MFTMTFQPPVGGCYGPTDATVDITWEGNTDPVTCKISFSAWTTWTNPCPESYALSYVWEGWLDTPTPTLWATSGPFTITIPPGSSSWGPDNWGPSVGTLHAVAIGRVVLTVTWPDSTVTTYTSYDDFVSGCA